MTLRHTSGRALSTVKATETLQARLGLEIDGKTLPAQDALPYVPVDLVGMFVPSPVRMDQGSAQTISETENVLPVKRKRVPLRRWFAGA